MALKCGIVGLPNVGKSTLFNALTKAGIAAENYPFCTIEPNVGIVEVPDPRLGQLAAIAKPQRVLPATVEFVDIAGLVAGASKGEGLGNQFLATIRETDAIAHVVRCFDDPNVIHVTGKVDPISDIEVIDTELALADLATVEKQLAKNVKVAKTGGDKEAQRTCRSARKTATGTEPGAARTYSRPVEGRTRRSATTVPAHDEAGHVCGQRGRGWGVRRQSFARSSARASGWGRGTRRCDLRRARGPDRRPLGRGQAGLSSRYRHGRAGPQSRDPCGVHPARIADLFHGGRERSARLDHPQGRYRAPRRRQHTHRFREGVHPRGSHRSRRLRGAEG